MLLQCKFSLKSGKASVLRSRAWCVFELAAFLSSHRNVKPIPVVVKPLELAPLTCWMIVAISASMLYEICLPSDGLLLYGKVAALAFWAVAFNFIFRRLLKDIVTVEDECRNFSWDTVQANCCSIGHVAHGHWPATLCFLCSSYLAMV